jgi:tape measure domain-containing protein
MSRVNISTLNIKITASSSGLAQQVNQAISQVQKLNTGIQQQNKGLVNSVREFEQILARSLLLYGTFKTISFAKDQLFDSVRLAAEAESAAISFEVLLGSAENSQKVIAGLYKFVETTPFRLDEVRRAAKSLAAYGVENDKIIPTLRSLGDVASATGNDFFELAEVYGRTKVEQRLYTKDLNQFTSRGIPLIQVFAKQFGVVETEVRKMAEAGQLSFDDVERAFASMTAEGGKFFGLTQRQAQTTAGEYSNFLDEVDALKREFGTGLLPTLAEFLAVMREVITGGDDATTTLQSFKQAGEDLGTALRITGGALQATRATLAAFDAMVVLTIENLITLGGLLDSQTAEFLRITREDLQKRADELADSAVLLWDTERSLREGLSQRAADDTASLSDMIGGVADDVQRARNQLKLLTQDSEKFLGTLRAKYITPMEEFEAAIREIVKADLLTDASDSDIARFLAAEVDRLNEATKDLKSTLNDSPALLQGTTEAAAAIARAFRDNGGDAVNGDPPGAVIERLRAEVEAEIQALQTQGEATAKLTDATNRLADILEASKAYTQDLRDAPNSTREGIARQFMNVPTPTAPGSQMGWLEWMRGAVDAMKFTTPRDMQRQEAARRAAEARAAAAKAAAEDAERQRRQFMDYAPRRFNGPPRPPGAPDLMGPPLPSDMSVMRSQMAVLLSNAAQWALHYPGIDATSAAGAAYRQFASERAAALESGKSIDAESPGLLQALIDELKAQREPLTDSSAPSGSKADETADEVEKMKMELSRLGTLNQTLLAQIANSTAATAKQQPIVIREYAA